MRGEADGEIEEEVDGAAVMAMPRPRGEVEPVTEPNLAPPRRAPAQRPAVKARGWPGRTGRPRRDGWNAMRCRRSGAGQRQRQRPA